MVDLDSNFKEIKSLNLFIQARRLTTNNNSSSKSFSQLEYIIIEFPKFPQRQKDVDFLLYNQALKIAFLIEVKGGGSVESDDLSQINLYQQHSNKEIEQVLKNAEIKKPIVKNHYTGIVYPKTTIDRCNNSLTCQNLLNNMKNDFIVMHTHPGEKLVALNPEKITWDSELQKSLKIGIPLPRFPKKEILFNDFPNYKVIIIGLLDYFFKFFSSETTEDSFTFLFDDLRMKLKIYRIGRTNLKKAIIFFLNQKYFQGKYSKFVINRSIIVELYRTRADFITEVKNYVPPGKLFDEINL